MEPFNNEATLAEDEVNAGFQDNPARSFKTKCLLEDLFGVSQAGVEALGRGNQPVPKRWDASELLSEGFLFLWVHIQKYTIRAGVLPNMLRAYVRRAVGGFLRYVSNRLLDPCLNEPEASEPPAAPKPPKPQGATTFAHVGSGILQLMLEHEGPKTVRDIVMLSDDAFPQSTVRQTCKNLVRDGLLRQVTEYPAAFTLADPANARAFIQGHLS